MTERVWRILAVVAAIAMALMVGAAVGGSAVYALTRAKGMLAVVSAQDVDPEMGIVIAAVEPNSPAAEAGVVRGDILLAIDDKPLEEWEDLRHYLESLDPGDRVELSVLHGDERRSLTGVLGERGGQAYLGVTACCEVPWRASVHVTGGRGSMIVDVVAGSPADEAALEPGDVIVAVDGQEVDSERTLADLIAEREPGDEVTLEIQRPGEGSQQVTLELAEHPDKEGVAYLGVRYMPFPHVEVVPGEMGPFGEHERFELDKLPFVAPPESLRRGLVVLRVVEDSPADAAGLERGDIITAVDGEPIEPPVTLSDIVAEREPGDHIVLTVHRPHEAEELEVDATLGEHPDQEGKAYLGVYIGGFLHMQLFGEPDEPFMFEFPLPHFDLDELPFDLEEWLDRFRYQWPQRDDVTWPELRGEST